MGGRVGSEATLCEARERLRPWWASAWLWGASGGLVTGWGQVAGYRVRVATANRLWWVAICDLSCSSTKVKVRPVSSCFVCAVGTRGSCGCLRTQAISLKLSFHMPGRAAMAPRVRGFKFEKHTLNFESPGKTFAQVRRAPHASGLAASGAPEPAHRRDGAQGALWGQEGRGLPQGLGWAEARLGRRKVAQAAASHPVDSASAAGSTLLRYVMWRRFLGSACLQGQCLFSGQESSADACKIRVLASRGRA